MPMQPGDTTGFPNPTSDHTEQSLDLHRFAVRHPDATYFWRVKGESMRDAGMSSGDVLVIDCAIEARSGDVVVAKVQGEYLVRRLRHVAGHMTLEADHPGYPILIFQEEEPCEIWGVVVYVLHNPNPERRP